MLVESKLIVSSEGLNFSVNSFETESQNQRLYLLKLDKETRNAIFAQTVDALSLYNLEQLKKQKKFSPFFFLLDPQGDRYFVADLECEWDDVFEKLHILSIQIICVCETDEEMDQLLSMMPTFYSDFPKIFSTLFLNFFEKYKRNTFRASQ